MNYINRPQGFPTRRIRRGNSLINSLIGSTLTGVGVSLGSKLGSVISESVDKLADETVDNLTKEMRLKNVQKEMELSEAKKLNNIPLKCPHCGAPTVKKLLCEYCNCNVM